MRAAIVAASALVITIVPGCTTAEVVGQPGDDLGNGSPDSGVFDPPDDPGNPGDPGGDPSDPGGDPGDPGGDPGDPGGDPGGDSGGDPGDPGEACSYPAWSADSDYVVGDIVRFTDGNLYVTVNDNPGYDPTISTWFWDPYVCDGSDPGGGDPGGDLPAGEGFAALLSEAQFNEMFPNRNSFYTYQGLVEATASYVAFAGTGDEATRKREAAAFLANVGHETGDLVYIEEIAKADYCQPSGGCPCAEGKRYYGRGPIQLSWNYNYCSAGQALDLPLQSDPDLVARDPKVAWQTGLWFWMTQSGAGNQTAHNAMVTGAGFGETIRTINGSLECGTGHPGVQSRIDRYLRFCEIFGVDPGDNLYC
jgi:predicted chitinase